MGFAKGTLYAVGGSECRNPEGNLAVLSRALNPKAINRTALVITAACSDTPQDFEPIYRPALHKVGFDKIDFAHIQNRAQAFDDRNVALAKEASLFLFTGGCQCNLVDRLGCTPFYDVVVNRYRAEEGVTYLGTSAGAMSMSGPMIEEGAVSQSRYKDGIPVGRGFGLIDDVIIDTHAGQRHRVFRTLQTVLESKGEVTGLHLDEDTGVMLQQGKMTLTGTGRMTLVDGRQVTDNSIDTIAPGEKMHCTGVRIFRLSAGDIYLPEEKRIIYHSQNVVAAALA